jgi:hypothetical protein
MDRFQLQGTASNRSAIGAKVVATYGERKQVQAVVAQSSYLSVNDRRLHFGLGDATTASLEIRWPNGNIQKLPKLEKNRYYRVVETLSPSLNGSR